MVFLCPANGSLLYLNANGVTSVSKTLPVPNPTGQNCSLSFFFWIDVPSDGAATASVFVGGRTPGTVFWTLRAATAQTATWFQQTAYFQLPMNDTLMTVGIKAQCFPVIEQLKSCTQMGNLSILFLTKM